MALRCCSSATRLLVLVVCLSASRGYSLTNERDVNNNDGDDKGSELAWYFDPPSSLSAELLTSCAHTRLTVELAKQHQQHLKNLPPLTTPATTLQTATATWQPESEQERLLCLRSFFTGVAAHCGGGAAMCKAQRLYLDDVIR